MKFNVKRINKTINTNREKRLFENLIYCRECGNTLTVSYRKNHNYWTVNCNRYSRDPRRRMCEPHFMPYDKLEEALLDTIRKACKKYIQQINIFELSKELWKVIEGLKGKITIILTTHYMEEAESLSDRIGVMANGSLVDIGTSKELIKKTKTKNFEDAFVSIATGGER